MLDLSHKFQRATRMIPPDENINSRSFILSQNNLYFKGDRSWFIIENYMPFPGSIALPFWDLDILHTLSGSVSCQQEDDRTYVFSSGSKLIKLKCAPGVQPTGLKIFRAEEYTPLNDVFLAGKGIFTFKDPGSQANGVSLDSGGALVVMLNRGMAVVPGNEPLDLDFLKTSSVFRGAVVQKALARFEGNHVYFRVSAPDHVIFSGMRFSKSTLARGQAGPLGWVQRTLDLLSGDIDNGPEDSRRFISFELLGDDLKSILPTLAKMDYSDFTRIQVSENEFSLTVSDTIRRESISRIRCECDGAISFTCRTISQDILDFLSVSVRATGQVRFHFLIDLRREAGKGIYMIIRARHVIPNRPPEPLSRAFFFMPISLGA